MTFLLHPQHTPGPWAVCTDATGDTFIASMTDSAETVCELGAGFDSEEQAHLEADARLIAAAPDLLEALEVILGPLNVCSDNPNVRDDTCLPIDLTMGELRQARAAIAKARGAA